MSGAGIRCEHGGLLGEVCPECNANGTVGQCYVSTEPLSLSEFDAQLNAAADRFLADQKATLKKWASSIENLTDRAKGCPEHFVEASLVAVVKRIEKETAEMEAEL